MHCNERERSNRLKVSYPKRDGYFCRASQHADTRFIFLDLSLLPMNRDMAHIDRAAHHGDIYRARSINWSLSDEGSEHRKVVKEFQ